MARNSRIRSAAAAISTSPRTMKTIRVYTSPSWGTARSRKNSIAASSTRMALPIARILKNAANGSTAYVSANTRCGRLPSRATEGTSVTSSPRMPTHPTTRFSPGAVTMSRTSSPSPRTVSISSGVIARKSTAVPLSSEASPGALRGARAGSRSTIKARAPSGRGSALHLPCHLPTCGTRGPKARAPSGRGSALHLPCHLPTSGTRARLPLPGVAAGSAQQAQDVDHRQVDHADERPRIHPHDDHERGERHERPPLPHVHVGELRPSRVERPPEDPVDDPQEVRDGDHDADEGDHGELRVDLEGAEEDQELRDEAHERREAERGQHRQHRDARVDRQPEAEAAEVQDAALVRPVVIDHADEEEQRAGDDPVGQHLDRGPR